jgi:hypothetical protein
MTKNPIIIILPNQPSPTKPQTPGEALLCKFRLEGKAMITIRIMGKAFIQPLLYIAFLHIGFLHIGLLLQERGKMSAF